MSKYNMNGSQVYKHVKTGGLYTYIGTVGGSVVYVSHKDFSIWWRPYDEFFDGRFQYIHEALPLRAFEIEGCKRG